MFLKWEGGSGKEEVRIVDFDFDWLSFELSIFR